MLTTNELDLKDTDRSVRSNEIVRWNRLTSSSSKYLRFVVADNLLSHFTALRRYLQHEQSGIA